MDVANKPEFASAINRIKTLYNDAEVDLKSYGRENNRLFVPGVNQLRYAGQHLIRALDATDEEDVRAYLDASERHAQRALYDINDAAIQYHLTGINRIRSQQVVNLNAIVPDYGMVVKAIRRAKRNLEQVSIEHKDNREKFYQEARKHVADLSEAHEILVDAIPDIAAEARRQNINTLTLRIGIWLSFVMLLLTFIRLFVVD